MGGADAESVGGVDVSFRKEEEAGGGALEDEDEEAAREAVMCFAGGMADFFMCPSRDLYSDISSLRRLSMMDCQMWDWNSPGSKSCERLGKAVRRVSS